MSYLSAMIKRFRLPISKGVDRQPGETYGTEVQNNLNSEVDSPEAPTGMFSSAADEQFDPGVDVNAEETKNYLIKKSRERMNTVVGPED